MNFFQKHWDGDYSLKVSFWVNTLLVGFAFSIPFSIILLYLIQNNHFSIFLRVLFNYQIFRLFLTVWQAVGVFRSADKYVQKGGKAAWAFAAKVVLIVMVSNVFLSIVTLMLDNGQIIQFWQEYVAAIDGY